MNTNYIALYLLSTLTLVSAEKRLFSIHDEVVIKGHVFRIFNPPELIDTKEEIPHYVMEHFDNFTFENALDFPQPWIQVWAKTPECPYTTDPRLRKNEYGSSHWAEHPHPKLSYFPNYLPLQIFLDENGNFKKDGDHVRFMIKDPKTNVNTTVELMINQKKSPYNWNDDFSACVEKCMDYPVKVLPYLIQKKAELNAKK